MLPITDPSASDILLASLRSQRREIDVLLSRLVVHSDLRRRKPFVLSHDEIKLVGLLIGLHAAMEED